MYDKRIKIFVLVSVCLLSVCVVRLATMQLLENSYYRDQISKLKLQKGRSRLLKTIRGKILDRNGRILAEDEPKFELHINYRLTSFADERVGQGKLLRVEGEDKKKIVQDELDDGFEDLQEVIGKCVEFGFEREVIESEIKRINDKTWALRSFLAWARNEPNQRILKKYGGRINSVPAFEAAADFEKRFPSYERRLLLISKVDDIVEMNKSWRLLELETDNDIFTAQLEFKDSVGVGILPQIRRVYPYKSAAAQTIGWVGPHQERDKKLFAGDKLSRYIGKEIAGREDGVEYVCEAILRGIRGELFTDIDGQSTRTETETGRDISLTLDIELQQRVEALLADCRVKSDHKTPTAAVIIDVTTGDILTLASMPNYDLNRARYDYEDLLSDANRPLINRAIYEQYPPGSVIKPIIAIAGLESGKITSGEAISCPPKAPPLGWPRCWIQKKSSWKGHDDDWVNHTRNAIKGSCNLYFTRLANRLAPQTLQRWLFDFGYASKLLRPPCQIDRNFRQLAGTISSTNPASAVSDFKDLPKIKKKELRWFGMGQGNLRVTVLQVANTMAAIARGGLYKLPRLFTENGESNLASVALNIKPENLRLVRDGMHDVINDSEGTAHAAFANAGFAEQDVTVYGKTGSTENPEHAWFSGFAEDSRGRSIAVALIVEGGQRGSSDAAPVVREIIQFCVDAEYVGQKIDVLE